MTVNLDTWSDYKSLKFWKNENFRYITIIARDAPSFTAGRDSASPIGRHRFDVM